MEDFPKKRNGAHMWPSTRLKSPIQVAPEQNVLKLKEGARRVEALLAKGPKPRISVLMSQDRTFLTDFKSLVKVPLFELDSEGTSPSSPNVWTSQESTKF